MTAPALDRPSLERSSDELTGRVWAALAGVRDPELDESITDLTFVSGVGVVGGHVAVTLRLPTYFCAPNFAYLMVADAHDAVAAVTGVNSVKIELLDHFASTEINAGVAERAGFVAAFPGQAVDELAELRVTFQRKAYLAAMERACRILLVRGWEVGELHAAQLFDLPPGPEKASLLHRRTYLHLSTEPDAYLMSDALGRRIKEADVGLQLRFAKATRVSIEGNGTMCRGLLKVRYGSETEPGTMSGVAHRGVTGPEHSGGVR